MAEKVTIDFTRLMDLRSRLPELNTALAVGMIRGFLDRSCADREYFFMMLGTLIGTLHDSMMSDREIESFLVEFSRIIKASVLASIQH